MSWLEYHTLFGPFQRDSPESWEEGLPPRQPLCQLFMMGNLVVCQDYMPIYILEPIYWYLAIACCSHRVASRSPHLYHLTVVEGRHLRPRSEFLLKIVKRRGTGCALSGDPTGLAGGAVFSVAGDCLWEVLEVRTLPICSCYLYSSTCSPFLLLPSDLLAPQPLLRGSYNLHASEEFLLPRQGTFSGSGEGHN